MRLRVTMLAALLSLAGSVRAETIWMKAKTSHRVEERQMRISVERVLLGGGDEHDLMRARVGLITLSRGEIDDPRTVILLLRMRREMGLSQASRTDTMLKKARSGNLSLTEKAWAQLELAHHWLTRRNLGDAARELSRGLGYSWRAEVRAETLVLRGYTYLRLGEEQKAISDFDEVQTLNAPRRLMVQAHVGRALAHALRGDEAQLQVEARNAFIVESTRATVSRLDPFWDLGLSQQESGAARAVLWWGQAKATESQEPGESYKALLAACSLVKSQVGGTSGGKLPQVPLPWGLEVQQTLAALWNDDCQMPAPLSDEVINDAD